MRSEDIHVGAAYTMKIGRNAVRVTVTGGDCDGWLVETPAGRTMTIRSAERFIAPADTPETAATPASEAQAEPTPATTTEGDTGEQGAPTGATGRGLSLLDAAAQVLREEALRETHPDPLTCKEILQRIGGRWRPLRGGKTPDRTLYSAILREITTKGDASRFFKASRGRFALSR